MADNGGRTRGSPSCAESRPSGRSRAHESPGAGARRAWAARRGKSPPRAAPRSTGSRSDRGPDFGPRDRCGRGGGGGRFRSRPSARAPRPGAGPAWPRSPRDWSDRRPLDGGLDRGAFPDVPLDAQELRGAGEVRGERVGGADPDPAPLAATVVFVERLGVGVRGGVRARLRRAGRRGKPPGSWLWARASKLGWFPLARTR